MALTYQQAVEQTITGAEQFHEIINGSATSEVVVEDGSKIPSVRKALLDNFYFKDPLDWQQGQTENVFNQLRKFTDGSWWYAPTATAANPITMGITPVADPLWKIYSFDAISKLTPMILEALNRSYSEIGYDLVVGFSAGANLVSNTQVLLDETTGIAYSWSGIFPKFVPPNSTPTSTGGIGAGAWVDKSNTVASNSIIYVKNYDDVWDGISDNTASIMKAHQTANLLNAAVSYAGISKYGINADAQIEINTSTDFYGAQANILNGIVPSPSFSSFTRTFIIRDPSTPIITGTGLFTGALTRGSRTPTKGLFDGPGYALIECGYQIPDRPATGTVNYKQSFNVSRGGQCTLPLSWDVSANTASLLVKYRKSSSPISVSGIHLKEGGYNNLQFITVERCNILIDGVTVTHSNNPPTNNINRIIYGYYVSDVHIRTVKSTGQPVTLSVGSYVIQFDYAADVTIDSVNSTWAGWASTGNNHVNGLYFNNSNINRVDAHEGGHNVYVDNCRLFSTGVTYGWGGGIISVTNSTVVDSSKGAVETRVDYGGTFFGSIFIDNIQYEYPITSALTVCDINAGASTTTYLPETISVTNISWVGGAIGSKNRMLINVYKAAGALGSVYAPAEIKIDGVSSPRPFYLGGNFDYGNMIPRPSIFRYDLVINNISGDAIPDKGNAINISSGGSCLVYFSASSYKFLLLEAALSTSLRWVEINDSLVCGLHTQSGNGDTPMSILDNCILIYPAVGFAGAVPIGGLGFGNDRFTTMKGCTIGYVNFDLSGVEGAIGNVFLNGSGTPPVLPATFTINDFFVGKKSSRFRS